MRQSFEHALPQAGLIACFVMVGQAAWMLSGMMTSSARVRLASAAVKVTRRSFILTEVFLSLSLQRC